VPFADSVTVVDFRLRECAFVVVLRSMGRAVEGDDAGGADAGGRRSSESSSVRLESEEALDIGGWRSLCLNFFASHRHGLSCGWLFIKFD
jgi:hypothetical protein